MNESNNPQKENGFTSIANELLEALSKFRIPGEAHQVLYAIMRKTYGYQKKEDWISNSQLIEMTGLSKGNASRSLSKLITHKIVIKSDNKLSLNKHYKEWVPFAEKVINIATKVIKSDNKLLSKVRDTKEKKETIQNKYSTNVLANSLPINEMITKFQKINPSYKTLYPNKGQRLALERLLNEHGRENVELFIEGAVYAFGKPYSPTITTPFELERKLGALTAFLQREKWQGQKLSVTKV